MDSIKIISKEIVVRRAILGITQEQLSDLSMVSMKTIYQLESGTGNPSLTTLEKVLDVLGIKICITLKKQ